MSRPSTTTVSTTRSHRFPSLSTCFACSSSRRSRHWPLSSTMVSRWQESWWLAREGCPEQTTDTDTPYRRMASGSSTGHTSWIGSHWEPMYQELLQELQLGRMEGPFGLVAPFNHRDWGLWDQGLGAFWHPVCFQLCSLSGRQNTSVRRLPTQRTQCNSVHLWRALSPRGADLCGDLQSLLRAGWRWCRVVPRLVGSISTICCGTTIGLLFHPMLSTRAVAPPASGFVFWSELQRMELQSSCWWGDLFSKENGTGPHGTLRGRLHSLWTNQDHHQWLHRLRDHLQVPGATDEASESTTTGT